MNRNHPIIIRFSGLNHPINADWLLCAPSQASDNRPIFPSQSSDFPVEIVRNRQTQVAESSDEELQGSLHFSRQKGESGGPKSVISDHPAIYPAMLRDRGASGAPLPETGEKRTRIRTSCPDSEIEETCRPIAEIVETAMRDRAIMKSEGKLQSVPEGQDKLKVIEAEAKETDKALKEILEKIGI